MSSSSARATHNGPSSAPRKSGGGKAPVVLRGGAHSTKASSSSNLNIKKKGGGSGSSSGKGGRKQGATDVDVKPPPPQEAPEPPKVGDYCCVYLEQCSDYFRPRIFDARLGGWHPAKISQVEKATDAPSSYASQAASSSSSSYHLTVVSKFFDGRKKFRYPSEHNVVMLMEPSDEDYASLSLKGDPHNIIFQAQPEVLCPGDLVFARYQAGDKWSRGRIVHVYEEGSGPPPARVGNGGNGGNGHHGKQGLPKSNLQGAVAALPSPVASSSAAVAAVEGGGSGESDGNASAAASGTASAVAAGESSREEQKKKGAETAAAATVGVEAAATANANKNASEPKRLLCSIAYDGGGDNGYATLEINVPFGDANRDDAGIGSTEQFQKPKPYVYLAQRGRDDVRWLRFELDRMNELGEKLPLRHDQQVVEPGNNNNNNNNNRPPAEGAGNADQRDVVPLEARQLDALVANGSGNGNEKGGDAENRRSLEYLYFRYDDVVRCVFDEAEKRHGSFLKTVEWPDQPRIQKPAGSRKRKKT